MMHQIINIKHDKKKGRGAVFFSLSFFFFCTEASQSGKGDNDEGNLLLEPVATSSQEE